ncbi:putative protein TOXD [Glarea lozoyensis 74030]|uniref:Enoyl reductase (ER) domain-containing protein n=1 Tax=Glarea lozoyensis (strain ATCC 74030 / MF5533) TaxID=1104152 RepID=H0EE90_GLAL7|nr:putative protein TOXD [Glarea lozoyensis 74030]
MALSQLLDCMLCGLRKQESTKETIPVSLLETKEVKLVPRTNRAFVVASKGTYGFQDDPFPEMEHDQEIIISNRATGLNPIDYKSVDYNFCLPSFPWITGREMAGVVEAVGSGVKDIKVGDHVWTSTYYRDRRAGTFQHFVTVPAHTVLPLPTNTTFTSAACLGVAGLTAAMTLWRWLGVALPSLPPAPQDTAETLLIWGGSTITGQFAIQIAKCSGLRVIAVTSAKTAPLARSLGAEVVIRDGKSNAEIVAEIQALSGNITKAIDLVGTKTAPFTMQTLSPSSPGRKIFAPLAMMSSKDTPPEHVDVVTVEMKQFVLDESCRGYAERLNGLVEGGWVRLPAIEVVDGGLGAVEGGLERLKTGEMGGVKLVVRF